MPSFVFSQTLETSFSFYPTIKEMDNGDPLFKQWQARLKQGLKKDQEIPIFFFKYQVKEGDTFNSLSSKMNGWQASLATINGLSNPSDLSEGREIILPTQKGIFIYDPPMGELQELLMASRHKDQAQEISFEKEGELQKVYFFSFNEDKESGDFQNSERYFFLDSGFSYPLRSFVVSSSFGWRDHPFTGQASYHKGIDLAAPFGTLAYPAKAGKVVKVGFNSIYGNYVIVKHSNNYESLYGHFRKTLVKEGQSVDKAVPLGEVGDTGMATGPHLHFEIYKEGELLNPSSLLK